VEQEAKPKLGRVVRFRGTWSSGICRPNSFSAFSIAWRALSHVAFKFSIPEANASPPRKLQTAICFFITSYSLAEISAMARFGFLIPRRFNAQSNCALNRQEITLFIFQRSGYIIHQFIYFCQ